MPDHRDTMAALAAERGWKRGVELGLGSGLLFARFLALGIEMIGVDLGLKGDRVDSVRRILSGKTGIECITAKVMWMATTDAAEHVPDGWADFVFVDAGHSYSAVRQDIAAWESKVREGGWFGGHDYHPKFPGVIRAVGEAFGEIDLLPGHIWARRPC